MPELNVARDSAGACVLGDSVYVFGGQGGSNQYLNSIETFNLGT